MTQEEKAKAYDELFAKAKQIYNKENDILIMHTIEELFPEFKESEDEKIRKKLITFFQRFPYTNLYDAGLNAKDALAWIEKQGHKEKDILEDVKVGDVLVNNYGTFILMGKRNGGYCGVLNDNTFIRSTGNNEWTKDLHPATKEQRTELFLKMHEAGWEWDAEKKEVKKIHVIDDGKAEMDYCFTKMMNGEKVNSAWSKEDEAIAIAIECFIQNSKEDFACNAIHKDDAL